MYSMPSQKHALHLTGLTVIPVSSIDLTGLTPILKTYTIVSQVLTVTTQALLDTSPALTDNLQASLLSYRP